MRDSATQTERERVFATSTMILRAIPEGALVVDLLGVVRQLNPAAEQLLGIRADQALDQPLAQLPGGQQLGQAGGDPSGTCEAGGRLIAFERQLLCNDESAQPEGELILLRDMAPELEAQRRQYDYLCRALHDVRVPLQAIGGAAEGLMRGWFGPLNDEQREFAGMIKENATHQGTLFSLIYDAYALSNNFVQLQPEVMSIAGAVHEIEHELAGRFAARPLSLTIELAEQLPDIRADRRHLRQVLLTLLDNALRYTFPGGAVVLRAQLAGDAIRVDVADTGVGIRADEQQRMFTPFFRGENPLKEGRYGGLNLVIAQRVVQLHGGQIWFESVEGRGSTFSFTIPVASASAL